MHVDGNVIVISFHRSRTLYTGQMDLCKLLRHKFLFSDQNMRNA